jgi:hypothetical protein
MLPFSVLYEQRLRDCSETMEEPCELLYGRHNLLLPSTKAISLMRLKNIALVSHQYCCLPAVKPVLDS